MQIWFSAINILALYHCLHCCLATTEMSCNFTFSGVPTSELRKGKKLKINQLTINPTISILLVGSKLYSMNIYNEWGFNENPFNTNSLSSSNDGNFLITGREKELKQFIKRLYGQPQIVTIEGDNGIGKTSLANVGIFRATLKHIEDRKNPFISKNPLFVPCSRTFQLRPDATFEEFEFELFLEIANTIITHSANLNSLGVKLPKDLNDVSEWISSPVNKTYQGSIGLTIAQIGVGVTSEINTSEGFEKFGLKHIVNNWLKQIFPIQNCGGIVCMIDNLELLQKSSIARNLIEYMRDSLLNLHGIRWVFCGSLGIVPSILSSPRLEGKLHEPIELGGVKKEVLPEIFEKRVNKFKNNSNPYLPITQNSFTFLYELLKENLRNTLSYADSFCNWVSDNEFEPNSFEQKDSLFMEWLEEKSKKFKSEFERTLSKNTIDFFIKFIHSGGSCTYSDFEYFDLKNSQSMKTLINQLDAYGLVICAIDENDNRRKSIRITSKGWLTSYSLNKNNKIQ